VRAAASGLVIPWRSPRAWLRLRPRRQADRRRAKRAVHRRADPGLPRRRARSAATSLSNNAPRLAGRLFDQIDTNHTGYITRAQLRAFVCARRGGAPQPGPAGARSQQ
jgi:hypothetical protein